MGITPLASKIPDNVKELNKHEDDTNILDQATKHSERVFLSSKKERTTFSNFLTDGITLSEVLESDVLVSENSKLILNLLNECKADQKIPAAYSRFLVDVVKNTPVAGLIQINNPRALHYLKEFLLQNNNIRSTTNIEQLKLIQSEIPALWTHIIGILNHEKESIVGKIYALICVGNQVNRLEGVPLVYEVNTLHHNDKKDDETGYRSDNET